MPNVTMPTSLLVVPSSTSPTTQQAKAIQEAMTITDGQRPDFANSHREIFSSSNNALKINILFLDLSQINIFFLDFYS